MGKQEFCGNFFMKTLIFIGEISRQHFKMSMLAETFLAFVSFHSY